jgi:hypothetical protein
MLLKSLKREKVLICDRAGAADRAIKFLSVAWQIARVRTDAQGTLEIATVRWSLAARTAASTTSRA